MRRLEECQALLDELNEECKKCHQDFAKEGLLFSPTLCKFCPTGKKIHDLGVQMSEAEQQWDAIDWTSSKWESLYKG